MLLLYAAAVAGSISPEAERLGRELAASGSIEVILPTIAVKETDELVAQHPELSATDRDRLRTDGQAVAQRWHGKLVDAFGHQYAAALSVHDLRALVNFNRTAAAQHYRAAMPQVTIKTLTSLGKLDFKGDLSATFCAQTGKLCTH